VNRERLFGTVLHTPCDNVRVADNPTGAFSNGRSLGVLAAGARTASGLSYGKTQSEAVSEELPRTVSATLPLGELNVVQAPVP